jgi:ketosteroid isomerase-like protein
MAHANEDLVREAFAAFGRGDIDALQDQYFAPDIRWHFPGRSQLAGDHEGAALVAEMLGRPSELSGGTHRIELHDVLGDDDHVVVLGTARAERGGRQLEVNVVHVFHVRDGKVTEAWTHHGDLYSVDWRGAGGVCATGTRPGPCRGRDAGWLSMPGDV